MKEGIPVELGFDVVDEANPPNEGPPVGGEADCVGDDGDPRPPTLKPVGCVDAEGVVGPDWGMGGNDSSKDAPNEEVGLKALRPVKPVVWGRNGGELDSAEVAFVVPVG